ncbi:STAS domain-containing protein [Streptomyces spiralis]
MSGGNATGPAATTVGGTPGTASHVTAEAATRQKWGLTPLPAAPEPPAHITVGDGLEKDPKFIAMMRDLKIAMISDHSGYVCAITVETRSSDNSPGCASHPWYRWTAVVLSRVHAGEGRFGQSEGKRVDVPLDGEAHCAAPSLGGARLEVRPLLERPGVYAKGEIGVSTRPMWQEALGQLSRRSESCLYVEMSQLTFIDVAGVTDLVMTARSLSGHRLLVLDQPPPQVPRILDLFWPGLVGIEVAA